VFFAAEFRASASALEHLVRETTSRGDYPIALYTLSAPDAPQITQDETLAPPRNPTLAPGR
jgi:hypothetical protein